jgi:hypothetical protein
MTDISLISDFNDYYDYQFDRTSPKIRPHRFTFCRESRNEISRSQQFQILKDCGFTVPVFNTLNYLKNELKVKDEDLIVVHTDEYAHAGDGKILMSLAQAIHAYGEDTCKATIFLSTTSNAINKSISYRLLCIGRGNYYWLKYTSNSWASNIDNISINLFPSGQVPEFFKAITERQRNNIIKNLESTLISKYPMWAIDFIEAHKPFLSNLYYAIDLNTAPGLKYTGIDDILNPLDIYNLVYNHFIHYRG